MLDILGNVFGKNKKSNNASSSSNQNGNNDEGNESEANDGYVFVSHNESQRTTPYTQATILTDELIRMGSSSSMLPGSNHHQSGSAYPSLDVNGPNPSLPFSSSSRVSLSVVSVSATIRTASPIDNVPFSLSNYSAGSGGSGLDEDGDVAETLSRVQQFVNNSNLSEYNFKLENSILRESLLT